MGTEMIDRRRNNGDSSRQQANSLRMSVLASLVLILGIAASGRSIAGIERTFEPRFSINAPGDVEIIGNTLLSCSPEHRPNPDYCRAARAGGEGRNNQFFMDHVDVDNNDFTFNSASARLTLRPNAEVLWAGLYWGARLGAGNYSGDDAPDPSAIDKVLFAVDRDGYDMLQAQQVDRIGRTYSAFTDVTLAVKQQPGGATRRYWVANVQAGTGGNRHAGWALVVVYRDDGLPLRNLTVFDGYANVSKDETVSAAIDSIATPLAGQFGVRIGSVVYDGDINLLGDVLTVNGTEPRIPGTPAGRSNFFDAGITRLGERLVNKEPDFANQMGIDIDVFNADSLIGNGSRSARISFESDGDIYYPAVLSYAAEVFHPSLARAFEQRIIDTNGGDPLPGETLQIEFGVENAGGDPATDVVVVAPIPAATDYVPGSLVVVRDDAAPENAGAQSDEPGDDLAEFDGGRVVFRLGRGASATSGGRFEHAGSQGSPAGKAQVSYRVRVTGGIESFPAMIESQANATYRSYSTGAALAANSQIAAIAILEPPKAQIALASALTEARAKDNLDGTHTFTQVFIVENTGVTDLDAVTLVYHADSVLEGNTYSLGSMSATSASGLLAINPEYTGRSPDTNLLGASSELPAGAAGEVRIEITVATAGRTAPYETRAHASGRTFFGLTRRDDSTDGSRPDADGDGDPNNDSVATLVRLNRAPSARDDVAVAAFGSTVSIDVLANDSDADGDPLSVVSVDNANPIEFGELVADNDGTFTYTSPEIEPAEFPEQYEFSYVVRDPAGRLDRASARIEVPKAVTDLAVKAMMEPSAVELGDVAEFIITARNLGAQAAEPVVLAELPAGLLFQSAMASQGDYDPASGHWSVGVLAGNARRKSAEARLTIAAKVAQSEVAEFNAEIIAGRQADHKTRNNSSSVMAKVLTPQLQISRTRVSRPKLNSDGALDVRYELVVRNTGDVDVSRLQLDVDLTTGLGDTGAFPIRVMSSDLAVNPGYDGRDHTALLAASNALAAGRSAKIAIAFSVSPSQVPAPLRHIVSGSAQSGTGIEVFASADFPELALAREGARDNAEEAE